MKYLPLLAVPFLMIGCATSPHTYAPPSNAKLQASTGRLSKAVDQSHQSARKAQATVSSASKKAKAVREETKKIKNLPTDFVQHLSDLEAELERAQKQQTELEQHLQEADAAKAQVEQDKAAYYKEAQRLADDATKENSKAVKAEKSLSWYRWHFWASWIVLGAGVIACIVFAVARFAGKFTFP